MISLIEFAEARGEKPNTVAVYVKRHPTDFEGHISTENNKLMLDEVAEEKLGKIYKLPAPVEVIEDTESRKALILSQERELKLQEELRKVEKELAENKIALIESKSQANLLEQKEIASEAAIESLKEEKSELKAENAKVNAELESEKQARSEAEKELERLKSRGFWARLLNK